MVQMRTTATRRTRRSTTTAAATSPPVRRRGGMRPTESWLPNQDVDDDEAEPVMVACPTEDVTAAGVRGLERKECSRSVSVGRSMLSS